MNQFSVCLCAPLMNEALLYTAPLPLRTHLQVSKEPVMISDTQYVRHIWSKWGVLYKPTPAHSRHIYTYISFTETKHLGTKKVLGDTKMRSGPVFCFNWFPWETGRRWSTGTEVGIYTSDDVDSSQAIECAHQLSVSFFTLHSTFLLQGLQELFHRHGAGEGEGGGTADKTTQQNPPMQMTQNGSTLNKHKYTL